MSKEMQHICENFDEYNLPCLHCTEEKIKIRNEPCFLEKDKSWENYMEKIKYTINCKCGWVGKAEQEIDILRKNELEYLLKQHVMEKHWEEFRVKI